MNELERDAIESGFITAVSGLYRTLYESIATQQEPGKEGKAGARFKRGLDAARRARGIALENLQYEHEPESDD